jgi:hypothetical protein
VSRGLRLASALVVKTLLIHGDSQPPKALRDIVRNGSTAVDEVSTAELSTFISREGFGVDRVIVWAAPDDHAVRALATNYAASENKHGGLVYVTPADCGSRPAGVAPDLCLSWPEDEDKLRLLFMTAG